MKNVLASTSLPHYLSPVLGSSYPRALSTETTRGTLSQPTAYVGGGDLCSAHLSKATVILLDGPKVPGSR